MFPEKSVLLGTPSSFIIFFVSESYLPKTVVVFWGTLVNLIPEVVDVYKRQIYGGGKGTGGDVTGDPAITITGGNANSVYGGGSDGGMVTGSPKIAITGGTPSSVYGGGDKADLIGNPVISMTGGEAGYVYGGGGKADNSSGGDVTGDTSITVANSAVVKNTVYGGGNLTAVSGKALSLIHI